MPAVADSTTLIHLYRAKAQWVLKELYGKILIPQEVVGETIEAGTKKGYQDAARMREDLSDFLEIAPIEGQGNVERLVALGLEWGEAEAITLAKERGLAVILDEAQARDAAESEGVRYLGTVALILKANKKGLVSKKEAEKILDNMLESGFRLSPQVVREFMSSLR